MGRIWKAIAWYLPRPFDSAMRAVIGGELVLAALLAIYHSFGGPPGIGTVPFLMNEEATASGAHDVTAVSRICAPDVVMSDAGCQIPGASQAWKGVTEIYARYRAMPSFLEIQHLDAQVSWDPDDSRAAADLTAETVGVLEPWTSRGKSRSIVGHELWTFALINGRWLVTSLTYNLCRPVINGG
jgi:hypothetical protein